MIAIIQKICNLLIVFVSLNAFAQTTTEAFDVKITGNGDRSLVFIPGLASSGKVFEETRSEFEDDFTCYTFTLAGFAGVPPMENPSFEKYKNAIADYLMENGIKTPILIGHSFGGGLVLAIAADYPDLPKKIVVIDKLPYFEEIMPSDNHAEKKDCEAEVKNALAKSREEYVREQRQILQFMVADSTQHEQILQWNLDSDRETVARVLCGYSQKDMREKIGSITCPTLVLLEPYFKNFETQIAQQYESLKTAQLKYAPTGRHFLMYGAKDWYLEQLHKFIQKE